MATCNIQSTTPVRSTAPAGHTYESIEQAGQCTLQQYFDNFPHTSKSFIAPPFFKTRYPEAYGKDSSDVVKSTRLLTKSEENKFTGIVCNEKGENAEYVVFQLFEKLVKNQHVIPLFVLRNFKLDINKNFRKYALEQELGINLSHVNTRGEYDAVVIAKDLGIALIEIKLNLTNDKLEKAEVQLEHGEKLFNSLMSSIAGSSVLLPIAKIIIVPDEITTSPVSKTTKGCHVVHRDVTEKFTEKWKDILRELQGLKINNFEDLRRPQL